MEKALDVNIMRVTFWVVIECPHCFALFNEDFETTWLFSLWEWVSLDMEWEIIDCKSCSREFRL